MRREIFLTFSEIADIANSTKVISLVSESSSRTECTVRRAEDSSYAILAKLAYRSGIRIYRRLLCRTARNRWLEQLVDSVLGVVHVQPPTLILERHGNRWHGISTIATVINGGPVEGSTGHAQAWADRGDQNPRASRHDPNEGLRCGKRIGARDEAASAARVICSRQSTAQTRRLHRIRAGEILPLRLRWLPRSPDEVYALSITMQAGSPRSQ